MLFGFSVIAALLVIGQFLIIGQVSVETRLTGFMGHWMTLSGELMLVFIAGTGCLLFGRPFAALGSGWQAWHCWAWRSP